MQIRSLLAVGALTISAVGPQIGQAATVDSQAERAVLTAMNVARELAGLKPLRQLRVLVRPARAHSAYLLRVGKLEHEDADGAPFWHRLVKSGFRASKTMGENLAMIDGCPQTAEDAVELWLSSPLHRANLLSPRFRSVGVGIVTTGDCGTTYYTTDFGG